MPLFRAAAILLIAATFGVADTELRTLDGKTLKGKITTLNAMGVVVNVDGATHEVPVSNLLLVNFAPTHAPLEKYSQVRLIDDTNLLCTKIAFKEKTLSLTLTSGAAIEVAHEHVTSIVQQAQDAPLRQKFNDLLKQKIKRDRVVALRSGELNAVDGTFGSVDEAGQKIEFRREGFPVLNLPVDRLHGMIFYRLEVNLEQPICVAYDSQGNSLAALSVHLKDGKFEVATTFGARLIFEPDMLAKLDFNMGKLTYLSALEPRKEATQSPVDRIRRDSTLTKSPAIKAPILLDKEYAKGLTMPPGELEYDLQGKYKTFKALAGVCRNAEEYRADIERRPILRIYCDGEERFADVIPSGAYRPIQIDVRDVNKLRIVVLPRDPNLPLAVDPSGDFLSLADARVTQQPKVQQMFDSKITKGSGILATSVTIFGAGCRWHRLSLFALALIYASPADGQQVDADVLKAQAERTAVVQKVTPTVVAVFASGGAGGGSGVLISADGYALSNYHVTEGSAADGNVMECGLSNGVLYDAVLVGHDKVGDVALIKLLPKKPGEPFPFATIGDSDTVREGDWAFAVGNPFLLATDFAPTVTFGLVSGVHRYQYPSGTFLEYTDCIQIDSSINPGNSGGPLFNMKGELIGINGRGSFDKRGRVNSGVGYAISINQIKNFLGHLKAGLDCDHASLGALIQTAEDDQGGIGRMQVTSILENSDVYRRGLDIDDELVSFAGRPMGSVNQYKNVLGIFPRGWRVPLEFRRDQTRKEILVRLMGVQARGQDNEQIEKPKKPLPPGMNKKKPKPSPAAKYFEGKPGFANYYFNRQEKQRVLESFKKHGDFAGFVGIWKIDGQVRLKKLNTPSPFRIELSDERSSDGKSLKPTVKLSIGAFPYLLEPLKDGQEAADLRQPLGSGGFAAALFIYHQLLTTGDKAFGSEFDHAGHEPIYPPPADGNMPRSLGELRVDTEVINSRLGPYLVKWFFSLTDQKLLALELRLEDNEDPCELYLSDYRTIDGRSLPHRLQVIYGDSQYGIFTVDRFELAAK